MQLFFLYDPQDDGTNLSRIWSAMQHTPPLLVVDGLCGDHCISSELSKLII